MHPPRRGTGHLDRRRQQFHELVELREAALERHVARHLELHADAEAVHAIRVVHRAHRQQVLEELPALAVVSDLHVAVDAAAKGVLDHRHRLRLGARTLQEAAVAALSLRLCVARHAAELRIHEEHRVARHRHVADHDARWVRLCNRRERVHPAGDVIRHLVLVPQQLRRLPHAVAAAAEQRLNERKACLRLHEPRKHLSRKRRQRLLSSRAESLHRRVRRRRRGAHVPLADLHRLLALLRRRLLLQIRRQHNELQMRRVLGHRLLHPLANHGHM